MKPITPNTIRDYGELHGSVLWDAVRAGTITDEDWEFLTMGFEIYLAHLQGLVPGCCGHQCSDGAANA